MQINKINKTAYDCSFEGNCVGHKKVVNKLEKRYKWNYIMASLKGQRKFDSGVIDRINTQGSEIIKKLETLAGQFPEQFKIHFEPTKKRLPASFSRPHITYISGYTRSYIEIPGMDIFQLPSGMKDLCNTPYHPPIHIAQKTDFVGSEDSESCLGDKIQEFCDNHKPEKVYADMLDKIKHKIHSAYISGIRYSERKAVINESQREISQYLKKPDILTEYLGDFPALKSQIRDIKQNANEKMKQLDDYKRNITEQNKASRESAKESRLDVLKYIFTRH